MATAAAVQQRIIPMKACEDGPAAMDWHAHIDRARKAGAAILTEVAEAGFGGWVHRADDVDGHRWMFVQSEPAA
jgi:uncharacterized glyoxalase superfamily protein PhnB